MIYLCDRQEKANLLKILSPQGTVLRSMGHLLQYNIFRKRALRSQSNVIEEREKLRASSTRVTLAHKIYDTSTRLFSRGIRQIWHEIRPYKRRRATSQLHFEPRKRGFPFLTVAILRSRYLFWLEISMNQYHKGHCIHDMRFPCGKHYSYFKNSYFESWKRGFPFLNVAILQSKYSF